MAKIKKRNNKKRRSNRPTLKPLMGKAGVTATSRRYGCGGKVKKS